MKRHIRNTILLSVILITSCGGGSFATELRVILASAGPLIESLNLGERKQGVVVNFTELAGDAATLADSLKTCTDNSCRLNAVSLFKGDYDRIALRGTFGTDPKLQRVGDILDGIITSAKIYYGGKNPTPRAAGAGPAPKPSEADIEAQIKELKAAMKP